MFIKDKDHFVNALTMLPGYFLVYKWSSYLSYPKSLGLLGYTITCSCSFLYHMRRAITGKYDWLRLDVIGQLIGLSLAVSQTYLGTSSFILFTPFMILTTYFIDFDKKEEKYIAYSFNVISILISYSFSYLAIIEIIIAMSFYLMCKLGYYGNLGHILWHIMVHICSNQAMTHIYNLPSN